jgi:hypothetical protein
LKCEIRHFGWEKTVSESLAVAGFVCDKAAVQAVVLKETTKRRQ